MTLDQTIVYVAQKFFHLAMRLDEKRLSQFIAQLGMICIVFERGRQDRMADLLKGFWHEMNAEGGEHWPDIFE